MPFDVWLIFVASSLGVLMVPGPTAMLVIGYSMIYGRTSAWVTVPTVAFAGALALSVSMIGLDAVQQMSPTTFWALKLAGAACLLVLAFKLWNETDTEASVDAGLRADRKRRIFMDVFVVTALNPKGLIFFVAFIPQFIARGTAGAPLWITIVGTYILLQLMVFLGYALLAGKAATVFENKFETTVIARSAAVLLACAALVTAWI